MAINPNKNYKIVSTGHVHTGQQILNLLELAPAWFHADIRSNIHETDKSPDSPNDPYGLPERIKFEGGFQVMNLYLRIIARRG
jgi:hypothetical protein